MAPKSNLNGQPWASLSGHCSIDLTDDAATPDIRQPPDVIDLEDSDAEAEDLRRAIALSLQDQDAQNTSLQNQTPASSSILGMDRKQMEAERLARLKRKRGDEVSPPPLQRLPKRMEGSSPSTMSKSTAYLKETAVGDSLSMGASLSQSSSSSGQRLSAPNSTRNESSSSATAIPTSSSKAKLQYPYGTVKRTFSASHARTKTRNPDTQQDEYNDISLPELLDATHLKSCLLSSFIWDFDWLFPHFRTQSTSFLLVLHSASAAHRQQLTSDFQGIPNVRVCFPPMDGIVNCMHSKLMLLFYFDRCRIIVPSANLTPYDWGVHGVMENAVFMIDLPLRLTSEGTSATPFQTSLITFLGAQGVQDDVNRKLTEFDFSNTSHLGFVHSIGGEHRLSSSTSSSSKISWQDTAHPLLGRTISSLGLAHPIHPIPSSTSSSASNALQLDFITSSLGSLTPEFLRSLYLAASGDDGLSELTLRSTTAKTLPTPIPFGSSNRSVSSTTGEHWRRNFRFYFPSDATIRKSRGGPDAAGTICFQSRWWDPDNKKEFPRQGMRDCESVRQGMLMHCKILYVRFPEPKSIPGLDLDESSASSSTHNPEYAGWAYVGSANLSESAWGRLVVDRASKQPKLNCRNWECGVVYPLRRHMKLSEKHKRREDDDETSLSVFEGPDVVRGVPVFMKLPGARYESGSKPWFFMG